MFTIAWYHTWRSQIMKEKADRDGVRVLHEWSYIQAGL